jgi:hypothetical protein
MGIPLHLYMSTDPTWRGSIVSRLDFHAAVRMYRTVAVTVVAEGLERQRKQRRPLFSEHRCDLAFGCAMNTRIGPALFPVVQISLRFLQAFKTLSLQWSFLSMADT